VLLDGVQPNFCHPLSDGVNLIRPREKVRYERVLFFRETVRLERGQVL
jgi:hypothetical protein